MDPIRFSTKEELIKESNHILKRLKEEKISLLDSFFHADTSENKSILGDLNKILHRASILHMMQNEEIQKIQKIYNCIFYTKEESKISPKSRLEIDLGHANLGNPLPACKRLALFICFTVMNSYAEEIFECTTKNYYPMNLEEISLLYEEFLFAFDIRILRENSLIKDKDATDIDSLSFSWDIDYRIPEELNDILEKGIKKINNVRKTKHRIKIFTENNYELGNKAHFIVSKGSAKLYGDIINHKGELLKENPWETFYKSQEVQDEKLALELCPSIPLDIQKKFFHRDIVRTLNYSLSDTINLYHEKNIDLCNFLIKENADELNQEIAFRLFKLATLNEDVYTLKNLLDTKFQLFFDTNESNLLLHHISTSESNLLIQILLFFEFPKDKEFYKNIPISLYFRYINKGLCLPFEKEKIIIKKLLSLSCPNLNDKIEFFNEFSLSIQNYKKNLCYVFIETYFLKKFTQYDIEISSIDFKKSAFENPFKMKSPLNEVDQKYSYSSKIIELMNYTFINDAKEISKTKNLGLLKTLLQINHSSIDFKLAKKVFMCALDHRYWSICLDLYKMNYPIFLDDDDENFYIISQQLKSFFKHSDFLNFKSLLSHIQELELTPKQEKKLVKLLKLRHEVEMENRKNLKKFEKLCLNFRNKINIG